MYYILITLKLTLTFNDIKLLRACVLYLDLYVPGVVYELLNEQPVVTKAGCCLLRREPETFPVIVQKHIHTKVASGFKVANTNSLSSGLK